MLVRVSGQSESPTNFPKDHLISNYTEAFGILRTGLIENIGIQRMKGFLLRYGWEMGKSDARKEITTGFSLETLLKQGPTYHLMSGYIKSIIYEADFEFGPNQSILSVEGKGAWIGSYEAEEHVKRIALSDTPVCHINVGYLNGYLSTVCKHPIIAKEITCVGMGDDKCEWILKSQDRWEEDIQEELQYYRQIPIVKELEVTYEQLLEQRDHLTKISNVHKRLTEEVIDGNDLHAIANIAYEITDIPCIIQDRNFRTVAYAGLTAEELQEAEMNVNHAGFYLSPLNKNTLIRMDLQEQLITPVSVRKEIVGYCTFVYRRDLNLYQANDSMLLEKVANVVSLFLLNERTRFEAFERMKGNFLEQLINKQYTLRKEILKRGTYVNMDLAQPFHIIVLGYADGQTDNMNDEFLLHEQIIEMVHVYFKEQKHNVLVGEREGKIVCLMGKEAVKENSIIKFVSNFIQHLERSFQTCTFKVGISSEGKKIESAPKYYEEAVLAQRMTITKNIVSFADLGIVGILINSSNVQTIKELAASTLGSIYVEDGIQNDRLIKTLYVFLANGGRLEQTMRDLSLSMSGLLYRLNKIESTIKKDLRNPEVSHQLFLILEALIALGELEIEE